MVLNSGHGIDPGRVDIAVSQYIRQVKKILPFFPEHPGKKVAEIMGEYLIRTDSGCGTDGFHLRPDITAVQWIPEAADEHTSLTDPFFSAVFEQLLPQLFHQIHLSFLSLAGNLCFPAFHSGYGDIFQFTDPDPGRSDGLHDECGLLPSHPVSLFDQLFVFCPAHFLFCGTEHLLLYLYRLHPALRFSHKVQKSIQGYQHAVCTARFVMLLQPCLVGDHFFLGNAPVFSHPLQEGTDIPQIFVNGGDAFFPIRQISPVLLQCLFAEVLY